MALRILDYSVRLTRQYRGILRPKNLASRLEGLFLHEAPVKHKINRRLSLSQLVEIAQGHLKHEENLLLQANQYLFTDTNALTTYQSSLSYHKTVVNSLHPKTVVPIGVRVTVLLN
jgi:nicotinamide riboside kinase